MAFIWVWKTVAYGLFKVCEAQRASHVLETITNRRIRDITAFSNGCWNSHVGDKVNDDTLFTQQLVAKRE
jgi:hypothetical protein